MVVEIAEVVVEVTKVDLVMVGWIVESVEVGLVVVEVLSKNVLVGVSPSLYRSLIAATSSRCSFTPWWHFSYLCPRKGHLILAGI